MDKRPTICKMFRPPVTPTAGPARIEVRLTVVYPLSQTDEGKNLAFRLSEILKAHEFEGDDQVYTRKQYPESSTAVIKFVWRKRRDNGGGTPAMAVAP